MPEKRPRCRTHGTECSLTPILAARTVVDTSLGSPKKTVFVVSISGSLQASAVGAGRSAEVMADHGGMEGEVIGRSQAGGLRSWVGHGRAQGGHGHVTEESPRSLAGHTQVLCVEGGKLRSWAHHEGAQEVTGRSQGNQGHGGSWQEPKNVKDRSQRGGQGHV